VGGVNLCPFQDERTSGSEIFVGQFVRFDEPWFTI
jgi:hypothetical protein